MGQIFSKFAKRWSKKMTLERMRFSNRIASKESFVPILGVSHLTFLNVGHMVGAGIFVLLGQAAGQDAGPAVLLSILSAGGVAGLSALCFCEMASDYPLAGGAFNYVMATFGEFPAWMTIAVIAVASVAVGGALARVWSSQLAVLCHTETWVRQVGSFRLDFVAMGITFVALTVVAAGTTLASWVNIVCKTATLGIIVAVLTKAYPEADVNNWEEFFPFGARGVFAGAAVIFFAYTGYDAATNMAEEAKDPEQTIWKSILVAFAMVLTLYLLMASALTLATTSIDVHAPFYKLFESMGKETYADLVTVGALVAVGTVLMVSFMVECRQFLAMARYHLIPSCLARVNELTLTPLRLTLLFGFIKAVLGLTTAATVLAELRSAGTLFVTIMVSSATLWRRYYSDPEEEISKLDTLGGQPLARGAHWSQLAIRLLVMVLTAQGFGAAYVWHAHYAWLIVLGGIYSLAALSFHCLNQVFVPQHFSIPMVVEATSMCIFGASFLLWLLGGKAVWRFSLVLLACALLYLIYGVHAATRHDQDMAFYNSLLDAGVTDAELEVRLQRLDVYERDWVMQERANRFNQEADSSHGGSLSTHGRGLLS